MASNVTYHWWVDIDTKEVHLDVLHIRQEEAHSFRAMARVEGVTWQNGRWMPDAPRDHWHDIRQTPGLSQPYGPSPIEAARNALAFYENKARYARTINYNVERALLTQVIQDLPSPPMGEALPLPAYVHVR